MESVPLPPALVAHLDCQAGDVEPPEDAVADAVVLALHEDLAPDGDLSASLLPAAVVADGVVASRSDGVLAGTACAS
ncbi:MAG: hypothetical protein CL442_05285 [Acidimicrobiaceae bacterium]|nr:hypothetical protein [Acidimicrobiaceae bacterium]